MGEPPPRGAAQIGLCIFLTTGRKTACFQIRSINWIWPSFASTRLVDVTSFIDPMTHSSCSTASPTIVGTTGSPRELEEGRRCCLLSGTGETRPRSNFFNSACIWGT